jgi:hypothetical protein
VRRARLYLFVIAVEVSRALLNTYLLIFYDSEKMAAERMRPPANSKCVEELSKEKVGVYLVGGPFLEATLHRG